MHIYFMDRIRAPENFRALELLDYFLKKTHYGPYTLMIGKYDVGLLGDIPESLLLKL